MLYQDLVGYAAASFVGLSFLCSSVIWLRLLALISNALFIHYGMIEQLAPVVILHSLLLPVNLFYLVRIFRERKPFVLQKGELDVALDVSAVTNERRRFQKQHQHTKQRPIPFH